MRGGFVVLTETDVSVFFPTRLGFWTSVKDCGDVLIWPTREAALEWIKSRPMGFWLKVPGGRPRILSARAAGVE